jgi:hypothetical protein
MLTMLDTMYLRTISCLSMIRSCPDRLEFKNEYYSTVNQVNQQKNNDICINIMVRTKTKPFLKRKKVPKFYFHF